MEEMWGVGVEGRKGGFGLWDEEDEANNDFFFLERERILIWNKERSFQDCASLSSLLAPLPQRQSLICPAQPSSIRLHLS